MWEYLARPGASDRVASFTSVSGPSADHLEPLRHRQPQAPVSAADGFSSALDQAAAVLLHGLCSPYRCSRRCSCVRSSPTRLTALADAPRRNPRRPAPSLRRHYKTDAVNSLKIYRPTISARWPRVRTDHYVDVPVQLIVNTKDPYVRPYGFDDTRNWVPRLWRRDIKAGHWSPMSHPQMLARSVRELVDFLDGKPPSRALLRAQVGRQREYFGDTLVSVTGAGSGIGRETALAFAREGAEVVISDIDEGSVKDTATQIAARGGIAHAYTARRLRRRRGRAVRRAGLRRTRRARHRGEQRRRGPGRPLPRHARRGIRPGARHQSRWRRQRLPLVRPPAGRARHRRPHRQRRLDGGLLAAADR